MKIRLNPEYAKRHLFVTLLTIGLGIWFGYDGFISYPATPAAELYQSIEKTNAPDGYNLEAFKAQKIQTQYGFTFLCFAAALIVGLRLAKSARFQFEFDDNGFDYLGRHYTYDDIIKVDKSQWEKKSIAKVTVKGDSNRVITLDAWHHLGVKDFVAKL